MPSPTEGTRWLIDAAFRDEAEWQEAIARAGGPETAVEMMRTIVADMGLQEKRRAAELGAIDREHAPGFYADQKRLYLQWERSMIPMKSRLLVRIAELLPAIQDARDLHQQDRRVLVELAKRVYLYEQWENGAHLDDDEDRILESLDELTISSGNRGERITLRELVEEIGKTGPIRAHLAPEPEVV